MLLTENDLQLVDDGTMDTIINVPRIGNLRYSNNPDYYDEFGNFKMSAFAADHLDDINYQVNTFNKGE